MGALGAINLFSVPVTLSTVRLFGQNSMRRLTAASEFWTGIAVHSRQTRIEYRSQCYKFGIQPGTVKAHPWGTGRFRMAYVQLNVPQFHLQPNVFLKLASAFALPIESNSTYRINENCYQICHYMEPIGLPFWLVFPLDRSLPPQPLPCLLIARCMTIYIQVEQHFKFVILTATCNASKGC